MKTTITSLAIACLALVSGCSTISYDDPGKVETLTIDWGSTDLQTLAGQMVDSLIASPALNYLDNPGKGDDKRILVYMGGVENRTSEHIDTEAITDSMSVKLLKSGKFRFTASKQGQEEIGGQVRFQQGSGRVNPETARSFGKQYGADVVIYGTLRSIDKKSGRTEDVWYQFVLSCVNIDTGEDIWKEEETLRKTAKRGIFGG
ncbi:MAG: penicillin-binding protein activator LpoB [Planctomycetota bacterium]|nr:penicillin-binding protein activator LpoB [Planctomycetota bacterium]